MFTTAVILATVLLVFRMWNMAGQADEMSKSVKGVTNGSDGGFVHFWHYFLDQYGLPFGHVCISVFYYVYMRLTLFNVVCNLYSYCLFY